MIFNKLYEKYIYKVNTILILVCISIYIINAFYKRAGFYIDCTFVKYHLNDTLAAIVFISCTDIVLKQRSDIGKIITICAYCSFMWEYIAQYINPNSTFDWIDILCYFFGGIIYWSIHNKITRE